tara:strand:+ start:518 stop:727 length:210 start_codon:yes stop_codon:yes gene_type:complete
MEKDWEKLNIALTRLHPGQWFGWKKQDDNGNLISNDKRMVYENIIVLDESITKPTKEEVENKIKEIFGA